MQAQRGHAAAIEALTPPPYPDYVDYLHRWVLELCGRSGVSEAGLNPLSWESLDAWARRTGRNPTPMECDALMELDAVMRHPESKAEPDA